MVRSQTTCLHTDFINVSNLHVPVRQINILETDTSVELSNNIFTLKQRHIQNIQNRWTAQCWGYGTLGNDVEEKKLV